MNRNLPVLTGLIAASLVITSHPSRALPAYAAAQRVEIGRPQHQILDGCRNSFYDEFDQPDIAPSWDWIDPDADAIRSTSVLSGFLQIMVTNNNNALDYERANSPRLMRTVSSASMSVQTALETTPINDYAGAGLLLYQDRSNFIRLERGQGVRGQAIYVAKLINGVWSSSFMPNTNSSVELKLERVNNEVKAYWRDTTVPWQLVDTSTITWTTSISAGLIVNSAHGSQGHVADFANFSYCDTSINLPHSVNLPLVSKPDILRLRGQLVYAGEFEPNAPIQLRRYQPGSGQPSELVATTMSDGNGFFEFANPPAPPAGFKYYLRYVNPSVVPNSRLYSFSTNDLDQLPAAGTVTLPQIEVSDIALGAPYDPAYIIPVRMPVQFNWTARIGVAPGDSYRFILVAQNNSASFSSPPLGSVSAYRLSARPNGFSTSPAYYLWFIAVDTPYGTGYSYNTGAVAFEN